MRPAAPIHRPGVSCPTGGRTVPDLAARDVAPTALPDAPLADAVCLSLFVCRVRLSSEERRAGVHAHTRWTDRIGERRRRRIPSPALSPREGRAFCITPVRSR